LNVLRYTKQLKTGEQILKNAQFKAIETINSPATGFISQIPKLHTKINEGQVICQLLDEYGELIAEVLSPCTGEIWAIRRNPSIQNDEILAIVSKERN
jgi:predicted deacylase